MTLPDPQADKLPTRREDSTFPSPPRIDHSSFHSAQHSLTVIEAAVDELRAALESRTGVIEISAVLDELGSAVEKLRTTIRTDAALEDIQNAVEILRIELRNDLDSSRQRPAPPRPRVAFSTVSPPAAAKELEMKAALLPAPPMVPALEVRGLTKRFGSQLAVDQLSFKVPQGSITGFLGPNGAGKTTTIRMLLHLSKPDGGSAFVLGNPIEHPTTYLPKVGALIESPAFEPGLSGAKNLRVLALLGGRSTSNVPDLLNLVGLTEAGTKPYRSYSLGMKQRLGIAAALLGEPQLLLLDEPTNGLDPAGINEMRALLRRLRDAGKTLFVSSHLIGEMERICDRLVVIDHGRLLYEGPVQGIGAGLKGTIEERFLQMTEARS